jgi:hypothetical protein
VLVAVGVPVGVGVTVAGRVLLGGGVLVGVVPPSVGAAAAAPSGATDGAGIGSPPAAERGVEVGVGRTVR